MKSINFYTEDTGFVLKRKNVCRTWLESIVQKEGMVVNNVNFIFCSDNYLHNVNVEYLNHDTFTDVITFPYAEFPDPIESDIFISSERCKANAKLFGVSFNNEIHRVMAHGLLHLLGYDDITKEQKIEMSKKEDYYLSLRPEILVS